MAQRILAIEVSGDSVRGALAERSWNSLTMLEVVEERRGAEEADLAPALARLLDGAGKPDFVVSALPGELVVKRMLSLPFKDQRRLTQTVPFALEEHLPVGVDESVVAFTRVGQEDDKTLVMAAMVRKDDLRRHLELLARAGINPTTVTLSALALAALLARVRNGHGGAHLLVDLDHTSTSMVLLDDRGMPRAIRTVVAEIGAANGTAAPGTSAILGAVRQTLLAHSSDHEQPALVLTGPMAATPDVRRRMAEALSVPVHTLEEFNCAALLGPVSARSTRFAGCLAMLLGEAPGAAVALLNFRQGEFAFSGRTGSLRPWRTSFLLGGAAVAAIALHVGIKLSHNLRQLSQVNQEIAAIAAPALGPHVSGADAKEELAAQVAAMEKQLHLMGGAGASASPLDTLLALSRALPPHIGAEIVDFTLDEGTIKLDGMADSFATVDRVKKALDLNGYFRDIQVTHATAGSDAGKVEFRLTAAIRGERIE
ncbi:MAG TPA: type II secretion system protein GspL [Candidatus Binataceae bacterium]|jgi:type II secretion system protein L|nr:type II secretion system protein GspL [Candidatus Binataceae bacterium]